MTWTKTEIEDARQSDLAEVLAQRGYDVRPLRGGAVLVAELKDLVVNRSYWFWRSQKLKGNPIDFFMLVEGKTFAETMAILCPD